MGVASCDATGSNLLRTVVSIAAKGAGETL
jgi:hypothetical protein